MKGRVIVVGRLGGADAAALMIDGRLEDLLLDPPDGDPVPPVGSVLPAKVDRPAAKTGGAFVRFGDGLTGFLRGGAGARAGAALQVQVTGYPEPGKAVPVTDRVLYKGRTVILTPGAPGINVSRRIGEEAERARLTAAVAAAAAAGGVPESWGWIARSAAEGASEAAIAAEVRCLASHAERLAEQGRPYRRDALTTALADWTDPLPGAIVASRETAERLRNALIPNAFGDESLARRCEAAGDAPFDALGVEEALEALATPLAALPSGGSLTIEPTRALLAVDVDTGDRFSGGAALTANLEAARELPRQLRLRGLGGQIAVDFAPVAKRDRRRVEDALKTAFRRDPVETSLAGWTPLGLFELSRKRERRPLLRPGG